MSDTKQTAVEWLRSVERICGIPERKHARDLLQLYAAAQSIDDWGGLPYCLRTRLQQAIAAVEGRDHAT